MTLGANQKATMSHADPARLTQEFEGLVNNWRHGRWLSVGNRYRVDCDNKIKADTTPHTGQLRHGQLASYIAASSAIHCMDGWSYVARAMEAELAGDIDAARHLAYYAELRAAMSLLASSGVGVFNKKHFALNAVRKCVSISGPPTHEFVWDALEHWADQPSATDLIFRVIQPGGKALSDWLLHFPPTAGRGFRSVIAKKWLLSWGLDLHLLAKDREARNQSSYRPTSISQRCHLPLNESLDFISEFWRAHEPSGLNPFKELDRHLLRRSLAMAFKANHAFNSSPQKAPVQYARLIEPMLHAVLPTAGDFGDADWREFLCFRQQPGENQLLIHAESSDPISSPLQHLQMIARATLLLRIATGATRENIVGLAAADLENLSFWWGPIGETKGLWEAGAPPTNLLDLWQDIEDSLGQLQAWQNAGGHSKKSLFSDAATVVRSLSSCERVALWGLGL